MVLVCFLRRMVLESALVIMAGVAQLVSESPCTHHCTLASMIVMAMAFVWEVAVCAMLGFMDHRVLIRIVALNVLAPIAKSTAALMIAMVKVFAWMVSVHVGRPTQVLIAGCQCNALCHAKANVQIPQQSLVWTVFLSAQRLEQEGLG